MCVKRPVTSRADIGPYVLLSSDSLSVPASPSTHMCPLGTRIGGWCGSRERTRSPSMATMRLTALFSGSRGDLAHQTVSQAPALTRNMRTMSRQEGAIEKSVRERDNHASRKPKVRRHLPVERNITPQRRVLVLVEERVHRTASHKGHLRDERVDVDRDWDPRRPVEEAPRHVHRELAGRHGRSRAAERTELVGRGTRGFSPGGWLIRHLGA